MHKDPNQKVPLKLFRGLNKVSTVQNIGVSFIAIAANQGWRDCYENTRFKENQSYGCSLRSG
ncbi:hypothetical protein GCM10025859_57390 [Alicyclobacillus fastidiosus]|nr:hypothetical protein GCM10025859_57390 [Alicyclobacillus fastidiosus]